MNVSFKGRTEVTNFLTKASECANKITRENARSGPGYISNQNIINYNKGFMDASTQYAVQDPAFREVIEGLKTKKIDMPELSNNLKPETISNTYKYATTSKTINPFETFLNSLKASMMDYKIKIEGIDDIFKNLLKRK